MSRTTIPGRYLVSYTVEFAQENHFGQVDIESLERMIHIGDENITYTDFQTCPNKKVQY